MFESFSSKGLLNNLFLRKYVHIQIYFINRYLFKWAALYLNL